jgi:hypothetical protein
VVIGKKLLQNWKNADKKLHETYSTSQSFHCSLYGRSGGVFKMGELTDARREEVWEALSDVFVDNEIDYKCIASRVADIEISKLKEIFFNEVAPVCGPNLMMAIPVIWAGFNKKALSEDIREKLTLIRHSLIAWLRYKGFVFFCRWYFKNEWKEIVAAIGAIARSV